MVSGTQFDYVTRTSQNQGVLQKTGFVNSKNMNRAGNWSLGLLQMDFFYRQSSWYAGQFVRKIIPIIEIDPITAPFFTSALNKLKPLLLSVLVRNVDKTFLNSELVLPVNKNGEIDFDFMKSFIAQLELEKLEKLKNNIFEKELNYYKLTMQEKSILENFDSIKWGEFKLDNLFERIKTKKLPYKAKDLPTKREGEYLLPCLTSSFNNQGLNYFAPKEGATIINNIVSIPSNSDVYRAYYQPNEFTVLSDAYAIRWIFDDISLTPYQYLFVVQSINKVTDLPTYSYKNKLGGWNVVKEKYIKLPIIKDGKLDYEIMESLISAIHKLVIEDVVLYVDRKQEELRELI